MIPESYLKFDNSCLLVHFLLLGRKLHIKPLFSWPINRITWRLKQALIAVRKNSLKKGDEVNGILFYSIYSTYYILTDRFSMINWNNYLLYLSIYVTVVGVFVIWPKFNCYVTSLANYRFNFSTKTHIIIDATRHARQKCYCHSCSSSSEYEWPCFTS